MLQARAARFCVWQSSKQYTEQQSFLLDLDLDVDDFRDLRRNEIHG